MTDEEIKEVAKAIFETEQQAKNFIKDCENDPLYIYK